MANQPNSYKKFVATAATAALVASALIPAASAAETKTFTDVNKNYKEAVDYLVANKITEGFSDTIFGTDSPIKRGDAAIFIANALGLDTVNAPSADFTDVNSRVKGAVNAIVEAKIASGKTESTFAPDDNITRAEMAKLLVNAYKLKAGDTKNKFTDVNSTWDGYVDALLESGVTLGLSETTFGATQNVTRGQFALFIHRAEVPTPGAGLPSLTSVKATNANTIEVTFNKIVDTDKAKIELLRGTFKQNVTVKWADDKKSVQLVGAGNYQAGDYTVNVSGLTDAKLTGSVKIEAQKVSSIQILSDVAVLSANPAGGLITDETATVGYVVKDQYGTDITKTTDLTTNSATDVTADKNGKVTIKNLNGKRVGDLAAVVLVHASSGTTTSATVKLSAAATVADITVAGLFNAKGEKVELNDATEANKVFLVVNLKDQYGNAITPANDDATATGIIVTNTNPLVAKLVSDKVTTAKIDGKNKFVVKFDKLDDTNQFKGGSAELLFITTMDGKRFNHTVMVSETKTTDAVSLGQPEFAIVDEDVLLPVTVLDKEGNVITDKDLLTHSTKGFKVNGVPAVKSKITVKDGQVYYNLGPAIAPAESYVTATVATSTYKIATVTYKVTAAAKPVAVRGLKSPLVLKTTENKTIAFANLNVEDQYGRTMSTLTTGYNIKVAEIAEIDGKVITVDNANKVTALAKNGTATITIYLTDSKGTVANSAVEQQVRVTDGTEYSNYEIATIGKVQAADVESAGAKDFTINGLLNGGKVALAPSEYTVSISGGAQVSNGEITVNKDKLNKDSKGNVVDTEFTLRVTIQATGKALEQKFVVSADDKKVEDFFFTASSTETDFDDAKAITEAIVKSGEFTLASKINVDDADKALNIATEDQYGNTDVVAATGTVTIVPEKPADVTITQNGTVNAKAELKSGVTETKLTVTVKVGNATKELKVTLK